MSEPQFDFKPLFKMLIDRGMKQKELAQLAGVSTATVVRLKRGENVHVDLLVKVCKGLGCGLSDIIHF